jgi:hypothetical protein
MAGTWAICPPPPNTATGPFLPDTMVLLTDGSALIHNSGGAEWMRYRPDAQGR